MIKANIFTSFKSRVSEKRIFEVVQDHMKKRKVKDAEIEIETVGQEEMAKLNEKYMKKKGPTDVLSFPLPKIYPEDHLLGTIVLCRDIIEKNSEKNNLKYTDEFEKVLRHGIDHLLGKHHD